MPTATAQAGPHPGHPGHPGHAASATGVPQQQTAHVQQQPQQAHQQNAMAATAPAQAVAPVAAHNYVRYSVICNYMYNERCEIPNDNPELRIPPNF